MGEGIEPSSINNQNVISQHEHKLHNQNNRIPIRPQNKKKKKKKNHTDIYIVKLQFKPKCK